MKTQTIKWYWLVNRDSHDRSQDSITLFIQYVIFYHILLPSSIPITKQHRLPQFAITFTCPHHSPGNSVEELGQADVWTKRVTFWINVSCNARETNALVLRHCGEKVNQVVSQNSWRDSFGTRPGSLKAQPAGISCQHCYLSHKSSQFMGQQCGYLCERHGHQAAPLWHLTQWSSPASFIAAPGSHGSWSNRCPLSKRHQGAVWCTITLKNLGWEHTNTNEHYLQLACTKLYWCTHYKPFQYASSKDGFVTATIAIHFEKPH